MGSHEPVRVLVVDDEPEIRTLYERMLEREYAVELAASGEEALDRMGEDIDVVLLDRRMQGLSGAETLNRLRSAGHEQPMAMVTAVNPDFDVVEMGFDDYVVKPVEAEDLRELVRSLTVRSRYDSVLRDYFALASKVAALQSSKSTEELARSEEYSRAIDDLNAVKSEAKDALEDADEAGELEAAFWETHLSASSAEAGTQSP